MAFTLDEAYLLIERAHRPRCLGSGMDGLDMANFHTGLVGNQAVTIYRRNT